MIKSHLLGAACACLAVVSFDASAVLQSRAGGAAYYDTDSQLTWLMDAGLAYTNSFGITVVDTVSEFNTLVDGSGNITGLAIFRDIPSFTNYRGAMSYDTANEFVTRMNAENGNSGYLGTNTWRLPSALNSDGTGPCLGASCTDSEFGGLYYNALGGSVSNPVTDFSPFSFLGNTFFPQTGTEFWTSTPYTGPDTGFTGDQWTFDIGSVGCEPACQLNDTFTDNNEQNLRLVWTVATGDVLASTVPVPAALWLFGTGLLGLIGIARCKKAA